MSKKWRILRIECHSLRGVVDLGGELHVKRRVSLIHIDIDIFFFVLCIFWFYNHLHTSCVVSILNDDVLFHSLSHMCCFFSLFIHMFLVYFTCHYFPHGTLMCFV